MRIIDIICLIDITSSVCLSVLKPIFQNMSSTR